MTERAAAGLALLLLVAGDAVAADAAGSYSVTPHAATPRERVADGGGGTDAGGGGVVITPAAGEGTPGRAPPARGPGIEMITGGNSTDGAARVGRLPVLD